MKRTPPRVMATKIVKMLKKERPDYSYLKKVFEHIRTDLGLKGKVSSPKKLPELLTDQELKNLYKAVWNASNRTHVVMIKLLLYSGIRNSELANITLQDVNVNELTIRIDEGKGKQDRYVLRLGIRLPRTRNNGPIRAHIKRYQGRRLAQINWNWAHIK